jgi:hypothetical protein
MRPYSEIMWEYATAILAEERRRGRPVTWRKVDPVAARNTAEKPKARPAREAPRKHARELDVRPPCAAAQGELF